MKPLFTFIFLVLLFASCRSEYSSLPDPQDEPQSFYGGDQPVTIDQRSERAAYDGEYCATVTYYNPNTGTASEYTLTVLVSDNELERINFPTGWLDRDHFDYTEVDEDGHASFVSDRGYEYTVQIIGDVEDCY